MPHPVIKANATESCLKQAKEACPVDVFAEENGKIIVKNPDKCMGCRACETQCEEVEVVD